MIFNHQEELRSNEEDWNSNLRENTSTDLENEMYSLKETIVQISSQVDDQVNECSAKIDQKVRSLAETNSEFQREIQGLETKLDGLDESIQKLSQTKQISEIRVIN